MPYRIGVSALVASYLPLIVYPPNQLLELVSMADFFKPAPTPPTPLGRYRVLSPTASVRVSPLVLGGGNIGDKWSSFFGAMDKEASFKLLDAFFDAGGNFIDTANN